jgi:ribokinase
MGQQQKIVVVGSSNTDMVVRVKRFPVPGETVHGEEFSIHPGGKGANQAIAAVRLGGEVAFVARLGNDAFGHQTLENFKNEGLDIQAVALDEQLPSGVAQIMVDASGENTIVVASGANQGLLPQQLEAHAGLLEEVAFILTQLETPMETIVYLANTYGGKGKKLILNPAPACELPEAIYKNLYAIVPNEEETKFLTGIRVTNEATAVHAAAHFHQKGVQVVVITLGAAGAFLSTPDYTGSLASPEVIPVDSTAAGDTFIGAVAAGLSAGMDWVEAVTFANRAAALSVTKKGAQPSIPFLQQVREFN